MNALMEKKHHMLKVHLQARGIADTAVLSAMAQVPREAFVRPDLIDLAYQDSALPLTVGQTISQPYVVALMAEALALKPTDSVLDIGTGSGYAAAVLSRIADQVYTVEYHETLAASAHCRFTDLGYDNVHVHTADGAQGWPEYAPFDAIHVAAFSHKVPTALIEQLTPKGRLVMPIGACNGDQQLFRFHNYHGRMIKEALDHVRFVPLLGPSQRPTTH